MIRRIWYLEPGQHFRFMLIGIIINILFFSALILVVANKKTIDKLEDIQQQYFTPRR